MCPGQWKIGNYYIVLTKYNVPIVFFKNTPFWSICQAASADLAVFLHLSGVVARGVSHKESRGRDITKNFPYWRVRGSKVFHPESVVGSPVHCAIQGQIDKLTDVSPPF